MTYVIMVMYVAVRMAIISLLAIYFNVVILSNILPNLINGTVSLLVTLSRLNYLINNHET